MTTPTETPLLGLRPYQQETIDAIDAHLHQGVRRQLIVLPTGTGKSVIFSHLPQRLGTPLLVLTHTTELVDQAAEKLTLANPTLTIGIEQASRYATGAEEIVVASIKTLTAKSGRRLRQLTHIPWAAVIGDEAHHLAAQSYHAVLTHLGCFRNDGPPLIGMTATPNGRSDGAGLQHLFETIAYQRSLHEMIAEGWLAPIRAWSVSNPATTLDDVDTDGNDFVRSSLARTVNTPARNALLVETWRRFGEGRRTLVSAINRLHAHAIALSFQRAGIPAQTFTGELSQEERATRLTAFKAGQIPVFVFVSMLVEGYDDPPLDCLLLAAPTKSALRFAQLVGRGTRIAPDKQDLLVIDIVDACSQHTIHSVASLFGLPPRLNLEGHLATETVEQVTTALTSHPTLYPEQLASVRELLTEAERLHLQVTTVPLSGSVSPEVATEATLAWLTLPSDEYHLPLGVHGSVRIRRNLLDQWEVMAFPARHILSTHPTRPEAFNHAEQYIADQHHRQFFLAKQRASWRSRPPTPAQRRRLASRRLTPPTTRGAASAMIAQLQHRRETQPATRHQVRTLQRLGAWREGMTIAEARNAITRLTSRPATTQ